MRREIPPLPSDINHNSNALSLPYTLGDYEITTLLITDEYSITYKATHTALNLPVMIKEFLPTALVLRSGSMTHVMLKNIEDASLYQSALAEYRQETNALLNSSHSNITTPTRTCIEANHTIYRVTDLLTQEHRPVSSLLANTRQKTAEQTIEQEHPKPTTKQLDIDFSILKAKSLPRCYRQQKMASPRSALVLATTTILLGILITGVVSYKQPHNEKISIEPISKVTNTHKTTQTPVNLTTIVMIVDSLYSQQPERKALSRNKTKTSSTLLPVIKKVIDEKITEKIRQTGRANMEKYRDIK